MHSQITCLSLDLKSKSDSECLIVLYRFKFGTTAVEDYGKLRNCWDSSFLCDTDTEAQGGDSATEPQSVAIDALLHECRSERSDSFARLSPISRLREGRISTARVGLAEGDVHYTEALQVPQDLESERLHEMLKVMFLCLVFVPQAGACQENWATGGKSGAPLYFSPGRKLVIKIIDTDEFNFLESWSADYRQAVAPIGVYVSEMSLFSAHMLANENSILVRTTGLYKASGSEGVCALWLNRSCADPDARATECLQLHGDGDSTQQALIAPVILLSLAVQRHSRSVSVLPI